MTNREFDAVSRLTAWLRDYGEKNTDVFNDDLRTVLGLVAEIERLREAIARMQSNASIPHRVKEIAREALGENDPCPNVNAPAQPRSVPAN
jgi:hypothetical protein